MASNFILGSGLIGRIAKHIYPDYEWIPFGKSQFYSWDVPLAENYISVHDSAEEYIDRLKYDFGLISLEQSEYKRPFSVAGQLIYSENIPNLTINPYLYKVYGEAPELKQKLISKTIFPVYSDITPKMVYDHLTEQLKPVLKSSIDTYGRLLNIDFQNHIIKTEKKEVAYSKIISTIPLDLLYASMKLSDSMIDYRPIYTYLLQTNSLDFEGANEVNVVEPEIDFYNVAEIGLNMYIIKSLRELTESYLKIFIPKFHIITKTRITKYITIGNPDLNWLEDNDIIPVGSLARWDDFFDVGTCINKLYRSSI